MATLTSTLRLFDAMSSPLTQVVRTMNALVESAERLNRVMVSAPNASLIPANTISDQNKMVAANQQIIHTTQIINNNYQQINQTLNQQYNILQQANNAITQAAQQQENFNNALRQGERTADSLWGKIKGFAAAYLSFKGIQSGLQAADSFVTTQARLGLIVDEGQTAADLQNAIFAAAQRSAADLNAMTDSVARLGLLAKDVFGSSSEIVAFAETIQKAFAVSGASMAEQQAAMYQLSQAMAAGKLQGDEFRSIMENAPMVADAIARYMGVSKGELRELSSEGKITADIIKNAIFQAAEDINKMFAEMPLTFGAAFQQLKNHAFMAFESVFRRLNEWLNSAQGTAMLQTLTNAINVAAVAVDWFVQGLQFAFSAAQQGFTILIQTAQNLGIILAGLSPLILGAAGAWLTYLAITKAVVMWLRIKELAIKAVELAQKALNFVLSMNPILRIITLIAGVVAATLTWIEVSQGLKKAFSDAFGFVVDAAEKAVNAIIGFINGAIRAINRVSGFFANLLGVEAKQIKEIEFRADFQGIKSVGQDLIENFSMDKLKKAFKLDQFEALNQVTLGNAITKSLKNFGTDKFNIGKIGKVDEVGKIRDTVDISSEDLKLMRELAEMKSIQNFVTLTPQITFGDTHIRQDGRSIDEIIADITERLQEEIAASAKGLFA